MPSSKYKPLLLAFKQNCMWIHDVYMYPCMYACMHVCCFPSNCLTSFLVNMYVYVHMCFCIRRYGHISTTLNGTTQRTCVVNLTTCRYTCVLVHIHVVISTNGTTWQTLSPICTEYHAHAHAHAVFIHPAKESPPDSAANEELLILTTNPITIL
jgi:hypothetical protein